MAEVSYTEARARLAELLDKAEEDREPIFITRHGKPAAALISADELASMRETLYLLRSPRNAARLLEAILQAERGEGEMLTLEQLRQQVGLDE